MITTIQQILESYKLIDRLKDELRHSWLSTGRQESVADHSWGMCLLAVLAAPHLDNQVDIAKVLKMIVCHNLVEALVGDIPFLRLAIARA